MTQSYIFSIGDSKSDITYFKVRCQISLATEADRKLQLLTAEWKSDIVKARFWV